MLKLVRQTSTPPETCRLLLRALAVLCAVSKGCISLLAVGSTLTVPSGRGSPSSSLQLGGLEAVLGHLSGSYVASSIEAAGVLTQLTNPQHSYVQLQNIEPILVRLLGGLFRYTFQYRSRFLNSLKGRSIQILLTSAIPVRHCFSSPRR